MSQSRRQFLTTAGAIGAASAVPSLMTEALASTPGNSAANAAATQGKGVAQGKGAAQKRVKLAISTYSYWHFRDPKVPVETVIDKAAALNVEGVDVLHRQMTSEDKAYQNKLKRQAFVNGLSLVSLSIHQDFVDPDPAARQKDIDHTIKCLSLIHI